MVHDPNFLTLGEALAQLPLAAPDASAWPALAARLARSATPAAASTTGFQSRHSLSSLPARPRRLALSMALAASLLALALLPRGLDQATQAVRAPAATAVASTRSLDQLMAESARLETLITASDAVASSASAAMLSLELDDRLQLLDSRLAGSTLGDAERQSLWQQRVALLRDYAGFESTRRWYAAKGRNLDVALVAAY